MNYNDRGYVLIVGGCGALGESLVHRLVASRIPTIIGDVAPKTGGTFRNLHVWKLNAASQRSIVAFREKMQKKGMPLSHIVNVVGALRESGLADIFKTSASEITDTLNLNLKSQILVARFMGEYMVASPARNKSITMISSVNADHGFSIPVYSAAKGGIHGLIKPLAMDLGRYGVRVNAVSPGSVQTPETLTQPKNFQARIDASPLGRLCTVDEVADAIIACITLTGLNGQVMTIDAGQTAGAEESLYAQRRNPGMKQQIEGFGMGARK